MNISLTLLFVLFSIHLNAQVGEAQLDQNNVSAHISDVGSYFYDYTNSSLGYEVPKGSGRHVINSAQFWFGAKDAFDQIYFVQGGVPSQGTDVFNGPISGPATYNLPEYQDRWSNSIWKICQSDIDQFRLWWQCSSGLLTTGCATVDAPSNEVLNTIFSWPAHGDLTSGQSYYLAPFWDFNGDAEYDPSNGDYPLIKGCCAVYMIQNDAAEAHSYTDSDSMGIEIHSMFYQYETTDYLNDVTFVDLKIVNKSNTNYKEFIHSVVVDAGIGNSSDDYYGCDSTNNCMFFYNSDNDDEDMLPNLGYGLDPPAIGIVSLKETMTASVPYTVSAIDVSAKWNLMQGLNYDGTPWVNPDLNPTQFVFSGNPNIPSEWSASSEGLPAGDARGIASHNHGVFSSGDVIRQSYAIIYARDGDHLSNVQHILNNASAIKTFYENESDAPCSDVMWNVNEINEHDFQMYPNPSNGMVYLINEDMLQIGLMVSDIHGKVLTELTPTNSQMIELNLSNQSRGVYFIHIQSEGGTSVQRIVIN